MRFTMVEPCLGLRLVRGPDWCWGDQDGGEGFVGTVVEVGEGGRSALVQWDGGTRGRYRCGEDNKFDLRLFDAAPAGLQFPDVICSGCYVDGVAGIHWQCAHCYEYHLCHSCYLLGRHCQEHPFFRVESEEQTSRVMVSCRADAKRVEAKGLFVGAEVVRGPHWRFGDQDGGIDKTGRVVAIEGWKTVTARSIVMVKWSGGKSNIYRVGHKGKMDLSCSVARSGGCYYPEHLATLGLGADVTVFDEDEIVAGDVVKIELDPEVFKMIHESAGLWTDDLTVIFGRTLLVLSVLEHQRVLINNRKSSVLCSSTLTKHCRKGQTVRVISDLSQLRQLQAHLWVDYLSTMASQIGYVAKIYVNGNVQVYVRGRGLVFNPLCLEPAPGETAPYTPDPQNKNMSLVNNITCKEIREKSKANGITDEALLDGDLETLKHVLYSNLTKEDTIAKLLHYYISTAMVDATRLCLSSGIDPDVLNTKMQNNIMLDICIIRSNTPLVEAFLEAGAEVNGVFDEHGTTPLLRAVLFGNPRVVRAIATYPGVILTAEDFEGNAALSYTGMLSSHINMAILVAAGVNPSPLLHQAAKCGNLAIMEVLVVHAKDHLNSISSGFAPLHAATIFGHTRIISLMAAQEHVDIDIRSEAQSTPLHGAAEYSYWSVVECLVGWGAALNLVNRSGNTPLHNVVGLKSPEIPESPQLMQVRKELSLLSRGRAVEGYIAVACFLVREGADWYIKNKNGVSPHQSLSPAMAVLISLYLKEHPKPGTFHGSLRREQQQQKLQELPLQLKLSLPIPSSTSATATAAASATATDNLSSQVKADSKYKDIEPGANNPEKSEPLQKAKCDEDTAVHPSGDAATVPCWLCEEHPASIRFSPCGHTVLCSECARRAKKCLQCKAVVETMTAVTV